MANQTDQYTMNPDNTLRQAIESTLYKHVTSFRAVNYEDTTSAIIALIKADRQKMIKKLSFMFGIPVEDLEKALEAKDYEKL